MNNMFNMRSKKGVAKVKYSAERILRNTEEILRELLEEGLSIDEILERIEMIADDIKGWFDVK